MRLFAVSIFAMLLLAGCSGGLSAIPSEFTRERADGKIPVSAKLIREQVRKEIDGMSEGEATVWRWEMIERDYHSCRLSAANSYSTKAKEVFANCMAQKGYVYMYRIDAEQFHNDIDFEVRKAKDVADKAAEKARIAAEKRRKEKTEKARLQKALDDALLVAVKSGNKEEEIRLIAEGANASIAEREHKRKEAELHRQKEAEKATLQAKQKEKGIALINAAKVRNIEKVHALIKAGANVNAKNHNGNTALILAGRRGHVDIVKALIKAGADVNAKGAVRWTALMSAASHDQVEVAKILINAGANLNTKSEILSTALMLAVAPQGHLDIVKILIDAGAQLNAKDNLGFTALMKAVLYNHEEIVKALINAGANLNAKTFDNWTALILAAKEGHFDIVKMLINAGANPNAKTVALGYTALRVAAEDGYQKIAELLIKAGANVNARDDEGSTALMLAAIRRHFHIAKILLDCGADTRIRDDVGNDFWDFVNSAQDIVEDDPYDPDPSLVSLVFIAEEYQRKWHSGWRPSSCKDNIQRRVTSSNPQLAEGNNLAENVFDKVWRSVVVIRSGDSQGSGVIVRQNVVATNCHVIKGSSIYVYKTQDRRARTEKTFYASILKSDYARDFCLLSVKGLNGIPVNIRAYNSVNIGEKVYALGAPKGYDLSLSSGIVSQLRKYHGYRKIQTDAAFSPGSSGGGLFDAQGNLIGILTEKIVDESVEGIGFAIPADLINDL